MSQHRTESLVGAFILVGLALLSVLVVQFGRFGDRFKAQYPLTVEFRDASGIIEGGEVRMGGAIVGKVEMRPTLNDIGTAVRVQLRINQKVQIDKKAVFQIASLNLLGDRYIEVVPPAEPSGEFLKNGELIHGNSSLGFTKLQATAETAAAEAVILMKKLERISSQLELALSNIQVVVKGISAISGKVNDDLLCDDNLKNLKNSLANIQLATHNIAVSSKNIEPAITTIQETSTSAKHAFNSTSALAGKISAKVDSLEPALKNLPPTMLALRKTAENTSKITSKFEKGRGLFDGMFTDRGMNFDLKAFLKNLREFGILRYRDRSEPAPQTAPETTHPQRLRR